MSGPPGDRGNPGRRVSAECLPLTVLTNRGRTPLFIFSYILLFLAFRAPKVAKDKPETEETQEFEAIR